MLQVLILLLLSCQAKINSTCFEQQQSVGGSPGSGSTETMITNINEVADVTPEYRVSVIETCVAESGGLSGVRASLGIWNATSQTFIQDLRTVVVLNPIGQMTGKCEKFQIPQIISQLRIGFGTQYVETIAWVQANGSEVTSSSTFKAENYRFFNFTDDQPFVGFWGFQPENQITRLGAIIFIGTPTCERLLRAPYIMITGFINGLNSTEPENPFQRFVSLTNFWFSSKMTETQMIVIITAVVVFLLVLPAIGIVAWLFVNGKIGKTLKFDGKWLPQQTQQTQMTEANSESDAQTQVKDNLYPMRQMFRGKGRGKDAAKTVQDLKVDSKSPEKPHTFGDQGKASEDPKQSQRSLIRTDRSNAV